MEPEHLIDTWSMDVHGPFVDLRGLALAKVVAYWACAHGGLVTWRSWEKNLGRTSFQGKTHRLFFFLEKNIEIPEFIHLDEIFDLTFCYLCSMTVLFLNFILTWLRSCVDYQPLCWPASLPGWRNLLPLALLRWDVFESNLFKRSATDSRLKFFYIVTFWYIWVVFYHISSWPFFCLQIWRFCQQTFRMASSPAGLTLGEICAKVFGIGSSVLKIESSDSGTARCHHFTELHPNFPKFSISHLSHKHQQTTSCHVSCHVICHLLPTLPFRNLRVHRSRRQIIWWRSPWWSAPPRERCCRRPSRRWPFLSACLPLGRKSTGPGFWWKKNTNFFVGKNTIMKIFGFFLGL